MLTLEDAVDLADFIIQLKLRNPFWLRETLEKKKDTIIDSAVDKIEANKFENNTRFQHIPSEIKQAITDYYRIKNKSNSMFSKQMQLFGLIQRIENKEKKNDDYRIALVDCEWMIYEAPSEGPFFITSDNPGYSLKGDDGLVYNTNFAAPFMFFFPISPKLCLVVSDAVKDLAFSEKKENKVYKSGTVAPEMIIAINNSSIQCISNLLVAHDSWYLSQIAVKNKPNRK